MLEMQAQKLEFTRIKELTFFSDKFNPSGQTPKSFGCGVRLEARKSDMIYDRLLLTFDMTSDIQVHLSNLFCRVW